MHKQNIAREFSRAAAGYDQAAVLQREIAGRLLAGLPHLSGRVVDMGCGTGYVSRHLPDGLQVLALDIAQGMLQQARHLASAHAYVNADAEALPLQDGCADAVVSSLAVQWCHHPARMFAEVWRVLRPGGWLCLTTLGPRTLWELRAAWAAVDQEEHVNRFASLACWQQAAGHGWVNQHWQARDSVALYDSARQVMRDLKQLGASHTDAAEVHRGRALAGRQRLQALELAYEQVCSGDALTVTYDVFYAYLQKPCNPL